MEFPVPRSTAMEAVISLQHIFRVARAVKVDPQTGIEGAVVYIVEEGDVQIVAETWRNSFESAPELAVVLVEGLPRDARVEWHVIRCQKSSDDISNSKFRMAFDEHKLFTIMSDLCSESGMLCISYGSQDMTSKLRSWHPNIAFQTIPSKAVYSVNNEIERHRSCTIILSE